MEAQSRIHWVTFASALSADEVVERIGGGFSQVERQGGFFQPASRCHESGARVYFGSGRADQPVVVNLPGEVCDSWADEGIQWASSLGWITRLDVACDVYPPELARGRMMQMRRAWKSGKVRTSIRSFSEHRSEPPEGWTWYFGAKSSALRLRAYDRRGPLRLEFQYRPGREVGESLPGIISKRGVDATWRRMAGEIKFPMSWYQELLQGDAVELAEEHAVESALSRVVDHLREQFGPTFYALGLLGISLEELQVPIEAPMRGDLAAKFLRWANDAEREGYDGSKLREEVMCKLK